MNRELNRVLKIHEYMELDCMRTEKAYALELLEEMTTIFFENEGNIPQDKIKILICWYWIDIIDRHLYSEKVELPFPTGHGSDNFYKKNFNRAVECGILTEDDESVIAQIWKKCIPICNDFLYINEDQLRIKAIQKVKDL